MKIILLQNVKGLGRIGDTKNVSDGYARNMLFPKKLAKVANDSSIKEAAELKKQQEITVALDKEEAEMAAVALEGATITFAKKASSAGTLFSSLNKNEVAKQLTELAEMKISPEMVDFYEHGEHIKHLGHHTVEVNLGHHIKAKLTLNLESE